MIRTGISQQVQVRSIRNHSHLAGQIPKCLWLPVTSNFHHWPLDCADSLQLVCHQRKHWTANRVLACSG